MRDETTINNPAAWSERAALATSWEAALWSESGQTTRFRTVLKYLELKDGDTLLDFGCGTGSFSEVLPPAVTYYAYDWALGMRVRTRIEHPHARVLATVPDMWFDHVVCIGTFNLSDNWSKDQTWEKLEQLWVFHTRRTLIASLYGGEESSCIQYGTQEITEFAEAFTDRFLIDRSHLDNDLLLVMRA